MKRSFFPESGQWLKGNVHSHTTRTDGLCPPEQQIHDYSAKNYDFLAITDHNVIDSHMLGAGEPICMIPGWERDIRHNEKNTKCIHVIGLVPADADQTPALEVRRYGVREVPDQQLLDEMHNLGQYVIVAHPCWSRMTPEEVLQLHSFDAIEVFNTGCERLMHAGHAELYWDALLQAGRRVWGIACDDTHGKTAKSDRFGGWIMVRSRERSSAAILEQMRTGGYYLSQGPVIEDWGCEDGEIYFRCSPCKEVHIITYPARGHSFYAEQDSPLTDIRYPLKGGESYIRIECIDADGRIAWTNPHFFEVSE